MTYEVKTMCPNSVRAVRGGAAAIKDQLGHSRVIRLGVLMVTGILGLVTTSGCSSTITAGKPTATSTVRGNDDVVTAMAGNTPRSLSE